MPRFWNNQEKFIAAEAAPTEQDHLRIVCIMNVFDSKMWIYIKHKSCRVASMSSQHLLSVRKKALDFQQRIVQ